MEAPPLIVEIVRSGTIESTHPVDAVLVSASGSIIAAAGDPSVRAAFRSSVKPIQARVSRESGWSPIRPEHHAVACASHNAEPLHVRAVRHLLVHAGLSEDALRCPPAWPFLPATIASTRESARVLHNCSGKHAGFLAACMAAGWSTETYLEVDHPLQVRARASIEAAAGVAAEAELVDGCGAPTLVFPLHAMARAFTTVLGTPEADAMLAHPFLVAGSERLDTALLTAGIVTKAGAEGLSCSAFELDGAPVGLALKVRDGTTRARIAATTAILIHLGALDGTAIDSAFVAPPTLGGGHVVGSALVRNALTRR